MTHRCTLRKALLHTLPVLCSLCRGYDQVQINTYIHYIERARHTSWADWWAIRNCGQLHWELKSLTYDGKLLLYCWLLWRSIWHINISKDTSSLQSRGALGHVLAYHAVHVPRRCLQPRVGVSLGLVFRCLLTCVNLRLAPLPTTSHSKWAWCTAICAWLGWRTIFPTAGAKAGLWSRCSLWVPALLLANFCTKWP